MSAFFLIPPPLAGEGGEPTGPARLGRPDDRLREPGGGAFDRTPPDCSLTLAATLPFQGRDKKVGASI